MTEFLKRNQKLPPNLIEMVATISDMELRDTYVRALRNKGWTLQSIAEACDVSRERVRQICEMPESKLFDSVVVPSPPVKQMREKVVYAQPTKETLDRLLELKPLAQQVRSHATRYRAEAEEYTRLLNHAHKIEGVSLYNLARHLGVTYPAIRFRLTRYGYLDAGNGTSKVYNPILTKNRAL
jgi:transcriptional regulator with XRE-family HTH domain